GAGVHVRGRRDYRPHLWSGAGAADRQARLTRDAERRLPWLHFRSRCAPIARRAGGHGNRASDVAARRLRIALAQLFAIAGSDAGLSTRSSLSRGLAALRERLRQARATLPIFRSLGAA